jgi:hypothetical protein
MKNKSMMKALFSVLLMGWVFIVQAAGYTPAITTGYPQIAIPSTSPQIVWVQTGNYWAQVDDTPSKIMPIGFAFNYAGVNYTNWSMTSNAVIAFETAAVGGNSTMSNSYSPNDLPSATFLNRPALMPFWTDLWKSASASGVLDANSASQPASASFYQYATVTVGAAQVLVIQLKNVGFYASPSTPVNMQIQIWSTGQIVYAFGALQVVTTGLRIGLQFPVATSTMGCHTLANTITPSLANNSFVYTWDATATQCPSVANVNHYEIRHDGNATLCPEQVTILACSVATSPCPAANIVNNQIINARVNVTGQTNVSQTPSSSNLSSSNPTQVVNLTWASGSAGTATLGVQASIATSGATALLCTNLAGTATTTCSMTVANTACVAAPHHFQIVAPGNTSACGATNSFTVKAWADAAETVLYTSALAVGTVSQTGNAASLPNLGAISIPSGSSSTTISPITFAAAGTTTFSATSTPALAGATTCSFGGSTSCSFTSASCAADMNCTETVANAANASDSDSKTGRLYTKLAGAAFDVSVVARKSDQTINSTYASDATKTVTVELVDADSAATCAAYSSISSQSLTFAGGIASPPDAGRKTATFTVANAYKNVRCRAKDNLGLTGCSADNFAIRPVGVVLSTSATAAAPGATASTTVKAGATFNLQATAVPNTATNYNGTLSKNTPAASYFTAQDPAQSVQAAGGVVGSLSPSTLTGNLAATANATYSEVGYLYLAANAYLDSTWTGTSGDAAGNDCVVGSTSNTLSSGKYGCNLGNTAAISLGRFIPDHFDTNAAQGCVAGGFTYSGQPFASTVTARNASAATTQNYFGNFAKAVTLSNAGATTNMTGNSVSAAGFSAGVGAANVTYTFVSPATAPVTMAVRAMETAADAVSSARPTPVEAAVGIRSGRVRLLNAYGSELLDLPVTMRAEYWLDATSGWQINTADSCTTTTLTFTAVGTNDITTNTCVWDTGSAPGNSGKACITPIVVTSRQFKEGGVAGFAGDFNLWLKAPGATHPGSIDVTATVPSWLQFNWSGAVGNPKGRATFGVYKSPLIYRRENY